MNNNHLKKLNKYYKKRKKDKTKHIQANFIQKKITLTIMVLIKGTSKSKNHYKRKLKSFWKFLKILLKML
jgi:hypothetical protein